MKRSVPLLFLLLFIMVNISHAQQGVSINSTGTAANASAMLDVSSTTKGALIPRMTNAQVIAIASPATGLFIYQTDIDSGLYYYSGNRWIQMAAVDTSTKSAWLLGGNKNTNTATHFIGTTDNKSLKFRVNNLPSGEINPTSFNTSFGHKAMSGMTSGTSNAAFGFNALFNNTSGSQNIAIGQNALFSNTIGTSNTAVGHSAGTFNSTGSANAFFGTGAGSANTTGSYNSFFGYAAGVANTTAINNSFFGQASGPVNTTGQDNTFLGNGAGFKKSRLGETCRSCRRRARLQFILLRLLGFLVAAHLSFGHRFSPIIKDRYCARGASLPRANSASPAKIAAAPDQVTRGF